MGFNFVEISKPILTLHDTAALPTHSLRSTDLFKAFHMLNQMKMKMMNHSILVRHFDGIELSSTTNNECDTHIHTHVRPKKSSGHSFQLDVSQN